jgi:hypothetical protein
LDGASSTRLREAGIGVRVASRHVERGRKLFGAIPTPPADNHS